METLLCMMKKEGEMDYWPWALRPLSPSNKKWSHSWPHLSMEERLILSHARQETLLSPETGDPSLSFIQDTLSLCAAQQGWVLDVRQARYLSSILLDSTLRGGPLTCLLDNSSLEEIAITGIGPEHPVRVYNTKEGWEETPLYFTEEKEVLSLLNRLARDSGLRLSGETPTLNARIKGGLRLHASIPPVSLSQIEASIRRFVQRPTHPVDLLPSRVWSPAIIAYLECALSCDSNLLVVGNTGSGKTTTLNALAHLLPFNERIITVEETPELTLQHPHRVGLLPKSNSPLDMSRMIRETLRMRPDRVVVGEIRFPQEAFAFMETVLAGQGKGTYSTFHGHSSHEAVARLRQFGILENDLTWVNVLVVQRRWTAHFANNEPPIPIRRITEVVELIQDVVHGLRLLLFVFMV